MYVGSNIPEVKFQIQSLNSGIPHGLSYDPTISIGYILHQQGFYLYLAKFRDDMIPIESIAEIPF